MDGKIIHESTALSFEGKISFPEVVQKLIGIEIERYRADLVRMEKIFYHKKGDTLVECFELDKAPQIALEFDVSKVQDAIKQIQQKSITYPEFLKRIMQAGTVSYDVYIDGKNVIYFGRKGNFHIENFPNKGP